MEKTKRFGVPYKGSKSQIAQKIIDFLPCADNFYDLFAGGCAITHCALLSNKWKSVFASDINYMPIQLFLDSICGKYQNEKRWINREEFYAKKEEDAYIKYCWSFGNNGKDYLYGKDVEEYKHNVHKMIFAETVSERMTYFRKVLKLAENDTHLGNTEILSRLQSLERLQSLQSLERLQSPETLKADYKKVEINKNSVIYCDIPYSNTICGSYSGFNHDEFYQWALKQTELIFISEYNMPDDFLCVTNFKKRQLSSQNGSGKLVNEKIFMPREQAKQLFII